MNVNIINIHKVEGIILIIKGRGKRIAISTSKIKNTIVIIKNRKENGIRVEENGSNPHSNGEVFSRSVKVFFLITEAIAITMVARAIVTEIKMKSMEIIFFKELNFLIGSEAY